MTDYSFLTGLWKSAKNTIIILTPAIGSGWLAFQANAPEEYQVPIMAIGGFVTYLLKNFYQVKKE